MRSKLAVLASAAVLALTLAGCGAPAPTAAPSASASEAPSAEPSAAPSSEPTARPSIAPIATIDGISVDGEFGKAPAISFTAPFAIDQTRSKVLIAGQGAPLTETSYVDINYQGVNAYTGETFDSSWTRGQSAQFSLDGVVAGFKTGLVGKKVGDRVLIVIPGKDGYDAQGGSGDGKILVGDTLVFVVDILDIDYQTPHGATVTPAAGLPAVTADAQGKPTVTIDTAAAPPTQTVIQPLIAGSSARKIAAGDAILVRHRMWSWKTGQLLTDKFDDPDSGKLADTIQCWRDGLVDQTLGSRVMLVCPPATGFPDGSPELKVDKGDTVVFLVDLIYAATAS
nr:peptidylprolyl isomerase [Propionibacterium sp.]